MNRQQRRHPGRHQPRVQPVLIGEGVIAAPIRDESGHRLYEPAITGAKLPEKIPGQHRWTIMASFIVSEETVAGARDPEMLKYLDHEALWHLSIGCIDCEEPLGQIEPGSTCTAPDWENP